MGKFDGMLICSDYDWTFFGQGAEIENAKAVRYFAENGGKFTFATGRTVDFMRKNPYFDIINAPACLFNGALVYDYTCEKILRERRLPYGVKEFTEALPNDLSGFCKTVVYCDAFEKESEYNSFTAAAADLGDFKPLKILCVFETPEAALNFKAKCEALSFFCKSTYISRSWGPGVEFNAADGTKGDAAVFIKEHLGGINTLIGIGDYENDLPLIEYADIGAAVGNAVECLKQKADIVTVPCEKYGLKELINILEGKA